MKEKLIIIPATLENGERGQAKLRVAEPMGFLFLESFTPNPEVENGN